jgi:hypothetical protein
MFEEARPMTDYTRVYIKVATTRHDDEDDGLPGVYAVAVDEELDDDDKASAALDIFHEHVEIADLDDVVVTVHSEDGAELGGAGSEPQALGGSFEGKLSEEETPEALQDDHSPDA